MDGSSKKMKKKGKSREDIYHVIHKVPNGDSPYVKAKHAQVNLFSIGIYICPSIYLSIDYNNKS